MAKKKKESQVLVRGRVARRAQSAFLTSIALEQIFHLANLAVIVFEYLSSSQGELIPSPSEKIESKHQAAALLQL